MKKVLTIVFLAVAGILFTNFSKLDLRKVKSHDFAAAIEIPDDVQAVIDNSCYGCHNSESRNEKARDKFEFDKLDSMKLYKLVGLLEDIHEEVEEGDMPPKKFLKNYPDHALSRKDKKVLLNWADETKMNLAREK